MGYPKLRDKCCCFQFVLWRLGLNLFTPGAQSRQGQWWQDSVLPGVRNPSVARCAGVVVPTMPAAMLCRDCVGELRYHRLRPRCFITLESSVPTGGNGTSGAHRECL